jgi:CheY-like chemotaxis protein
MQRTRILFVDDDPQILRALRNVLRRDAGRWDLVFVEGGQAALDELANGFFDVVVSDMHMPEVDGTRVMEYVRESSPSTMRLIVTGSVDDGDTERVRALVHELLEKPCPPSVLRAAIERVLAARMLAQQAS